MGVANSVCVTMTRGVGVRSLMNCDIKKKILSDTFLVVHVLVGFPSTDETETYNRETLYQGQMFLLCWRE